ncbi:MAG: glycoside hydrolase family 27 protein [Brevundimonas sp.]|nr:MAG: glycoside hydrolase family 27 protein [Brevundimonas sp.]
MRLSALLCALLLLTPMAAARADVVPTGTDRPEEWPTEGNGLAQTPPMGWNTWNKFACNVDEQLIRGAADAMVANGMRDAGYQYIVIDDCWHGERDADGFIQPDPVRFPSGMKALGDYIHSKGLKFGIYSDAGTKTCAGRPGSRGHEYQDAIQYARWGVDYLKYDWCSTGTQDQRASYLTMALALKATGRDIVFSLCEWGNSQPWLWATHVGNLWRTTGDIHDAWEGTFDYRIGLMNIVDLNADLAPFAGPGHWNDPDMLQIGNGGMTTEEYRTHFSLWAMMAAPLMAGNDLATMTPEIHEILTNREVIAVDQDALGRAGARTWKDGDKEVWSRPLVGGGRAVILLNRGETAQTISVDWETLGLPAATRMAVRDLWAHRDLRAARGSFSAQVPSHGVVMVTLKG